jgi:CheY-like chemotaxis protein
MSDKKKILIVDDEADVVTYLSTLLEDAGYEIDTATDGKQCMEAVRASRPDLITLDMTMPEQSGVKTYRELKEKNPELADIPVIVVTAIGDEMERFLGSRKQVPNPEGFMSKPIDKERLLQMVSELLGR